MNRDPNVATAKTLESVQSRVPGFTSHKAVLQQTSIRNNKVTDRRRDRRSLRPLDYPFTWFKSQLNLYKIKSNNLHSIILTKIHELAHFRSEI